MDRVGVGVESITVREQKRPEPKHPINFRYVEW